MMAKILTLPFWYYVPYHVRYRVGKQYLYLLMFSGGLLVFGCMGLLHCTELSAVYVAGEML